MILSIFKKIQKSDFKYSCIIQLKNDVRMVDESSCIILYLCILVVRRTRANTAEASPQ